MLNIVSEHFKSQQIKMWLSVIIIVICLGHTPTQAKTLQMSKRAADSNSENGKIENLFGDIGGREPVDLIVALDRSKSMGKEVFYLRAKKMAQAILTQYATLHTEYTRLAVMTFAVDSTIIFDGISNPDSAKTKCSLFGGGDDSVWNQVMFTQNDTLVKGTNIKEAFTNAIDIFKNGKIHRPSAKRIILIITDGKYDSNYDPIAESDELKQNLGVTIYGIGIGVWLEIGNVRIITSLDAEAVHLYGHYDDWKTMILESEEHVTSYNSDTRPDYRTSYPEYCAEGCPENSGCYCDLDRGFEQCLCSEGYYFNATGDCIACEENTYKPAKGNDAACLACPPGTEAPSGAIIKNQCSCTSEPCSDPCDPDPCNSHQLCVARNESGYQCECQDGWEGPDCDVNTDSCLLTPEACEPESMCMDGLGTNVYTCVVKTWGYGGRYGELNLNECTFDMCENNSTCTDLVNNFNCECQTGYIGRFCQDNEVKPTPTPAPEQLPSTTPTTSPGSTTAKVTEPKDDNLLWIIIGASAGGGLLIIIIIIVVCCCVCRKKKEEKSDKEVKHIANQFSGFWKNRTVRGNKWMDVDVNGGLPSAPSIHRPDLLDNTNNVHGSIENLKTDEYAELPDQTYTLKTGMESWQNYITELEESKVIDRALIVKTDGQKKAKTSAWMFDDDEITRMEILMENTEENVPLSIQDGEYHITENDGIQAFGMTIGSDQEPRVIALGRTKTYFVAAIALSEKDDGKARREVQWILDHISGEGY